MWETAMGTDRAGTLQTCPREMCTWVLVWGVAIEVSPECALTFEPAQKHVPIQATDVFADRWTLALGRRAATIRFMARGLGAGA